ncbi:hypothetical protein LTS08_005914 [Lithohypha guttulata]|uniref:uncharacterized protein n=1 Tax=Lithohypha guttulata TaxID=1690604 RepID=UPI002DE18940|nr:hypothetical protein LTR51_002427 [Lithohypha guttulata]KAK5099333.1 hypothetical protein LTS08_005914 [Lithohypha guttulata]
MSQMQILKNRKEYTQALMPDGVVVMEGVTKNCPICKGMRPAVDNLIKKYPDARFYKYDVDEAEDIAQELGARNVPNFSVFKDGFIQDGVTGLKPQELEKVIKENYDGQVVG